MRVASCGRLIRTALCALMALFLAFGSSPIGLFAPGSAFAQAEDSGDSGMPCSDEQEQTVRVGFLNTAGYEEGAEGECKSGWGYEYLQALSNHTGWRYEYVYGSFSELMEQLRSGQIDLMGNISYTPERAEDLLFSARPQGQGRGGRVRRQTHRRDRWAGANQQRQALPPGARRATAIRFLFHQPRAFRCA